MKFRVCFTAVALALALPAAHADITYQQRVTVEAAGGMSLFASDGEITTQLSADRSRSDSVIKMRSRMAGMFAGSGESGSIVRLDRGLMWDLSPDKQQYTEMTFAEARAQMEQAQQAMKDMQASGPGGMLPVSAEDCQWTEGIAQVENTDETAAIAGINARKHVVRLQQSCTDPDSGKTCDITWLMESWMAENVPGEAEARAFAQAYADALGLQEAMQQAQGPGRSLLAMFAGNWEDVAGQLENLQGYPLRTVMQMGIGGEQCTTAAGQPIALDSLWADASTAAYNAALNQAGAEAGSAVGRAAAQSFGSSVGGSIGGAAVGAAAGEVIGGLTGMFSKKKAPEPAAQQAQAAVPGEQITVFRITSEVTSWSAAPVPAERFEVPAGWKKM